jgi:hypothetical protein
MKKWIVCATWAVILPGLMLMAGCDWQGGGGADTWGDQYNVVNFSGIYRGTDGVPLVSDYTESGTVGGNTTIAHEVVGTANGAQQAFGKSLSRGEIVPGSITVLAAGITFTDDGVGAWNGGIGGSVSYALGQVYIVFPAPPANGTVIEISYEYRVVNSGASGSAIVALTVWHDGEQLSITDNNGRQYKGKLGEPRGTGSPQADTNGNEVLTGIVLSQFEAKGTSAAGVSVRMVGTFQGEAAGVGGGGLIDRRIIGTWIENNGRTGDINGIAQE